MTDGRHFKAPTAITLPKGATTWNNKSLLCSFLLLPSFSFFYFLLHRLLPQQGGDLTQHTAVNDKPVRHMRRKKKGGWEEGTCRGDFDILADERKRGTIYTIE